MNILLRSMSCLFLLVLIGNAPGQSTPALDPYRGFVGVWTGTDEWVKGKSTVREGVQITFSEEKGGKVLRCETIYGVKGDIVNERAVRHYRFDVANDNVTIKVDSHSLFNIEPTTYQASGLDKFAHDGVGAYTLTAKVLEHGRKVFYRGYFALQVDEFNYTWETSADNVTWLPYGHFSLKRKSSPKP